MPAVAGPGFSAGLFWLWVKSVVLPLLFWQGEFLLHTSGKLENRRIKKGEGNLKREEKREQAIRFLREKERLLGRCPKRSDFSGADAGWIKQILGPWPRALEAAGLKEAPSRGKSHPRRAQQPFAQKTEEPNDGKEAETK